MFLYLDPAFQPYQDFFLREYPDRRHKITNIAFVPFRDGSTGLPHYIGSLLHVAVQFHIFCLLPLQFGTFVLQLCLLGKDRLESFHVVGTIAGGYRDEGGVKLLCQGFQSVVDICDSEFSASVGAYHHL